ncbi:MAG TPA: TM2 domain-containing protein [Pirellulaceae bacterium]|nr:TM2 domain-containing protein [Pirellulaceae bacterium]
MSYSYPTPQYVKYVPVGYVRSHSVFLGYLFWLVGFTGAHRFYFGKPLTGALWFFTFGLLGIGWLVDFFLIPSMAQHASYRYPPGNVDYNLAWVMLCFAGWLGLHRFYQGKILTGLIYLFTFGLFGIGWVYDLCTLNEQVVDINQYRRIAYGESRPVYF